MQIAQLKAALARKEGGALPLSNLGSPVSSSSSPSHSSYNSKTEDQSNCSSRRNSLDSQDSWPTIQEAVKAVSPMHGRSRRGSARQSPEVSRIKPTTAATTPSSSSSSNRRLSLDNGDSDFGGESSDLDCQLNFQKSSSLPTIIGSKLKKPTPKPLKNQEQPK